MNITFACPKCDQASRIEFNDSTESLSCTHCRQEIDTPAGAIQGEQVTQCLVCPSHDLFIRKDFPQKLGVLLVVIGIVGSSIAWYYTRLDWTFGILFATALIDVLLYAMVGDALMCYRCGAQYRGVDEMDSHGQFDLETHERYRQIDARLAQ
ncbi:hypothetical protein [Adhaeretor mobilis]|uniref:Uncharacterized protein n=1 Tax=Adhaeretor mobilis TaxID=1930276 RepID=A0A517MUU1_9BACT|nr:hypothetical protein [Adhaeretor mobilis]QDS98557.1 hypothetical protein HG15A2_18380 [Adhaeretor mobilis]